MDLGLFLSGTVFAVCFAFLHHRPSVWRERVLVFLLFFFFFFFSSFLFFLVCSNNSFSVLTKLKESRVSGSFPSLMLDVGSSSTRLYFPEHNFTIFGRHNWVQTSSIHPLVSISPEDRDRQAHHGAEF